MNRRRLRNALRYIASGNFGLLWQKTQSVVERSDAATLSQPLQRLLAIAQQVPVHFDPLPEPVDLVVPVYNNLAALPRLFDSLRDNTRTDYRLIVVDDASSDTKVLPYLKARLGEHPGSLLLQHKENRGFVASVNLASQSVRHNFVLVNSDVELPPHWLERLMTPIFRDAKVASTTPFTNAGTICSFPQTNQDNDLYLELTVAQIDEAFQGISAAVEAIELPSGVGFCMGINHAVWQQIGGFDEATFGRGYGEENDWCRRAKAKGFRNLLVTNLFVRHDHGGSFGEDHASALKDRNLLKVHQRHPDYQQALDDYVRRDPTAPHRALTAMKLAAQHSPREGGAALILDHDLGGGANHYRRIELARRIDSGQPVLLLTNTTNDLFGKQAYSLSFHSKTLILHFRLEAVSELQELSGVVDIGTILCSNLLSYADPLDTLKTLQAIKRSSGAQSILAVHDFFPLCPSHNLLDSHGQFCNLPDETVCARCLPANRFAEARKGMDIGPWRRAWGVFIDQVDEIRCFSESSRDLFARIYPTAASAIVVTPHDLPTPPPRRPKLAFDQPLNIGVVGDIGYAKGAAMVTELAETLQRDQPEARITVIGALEAAKLPQNVTSTGFYDPADLPNLMERHGVNVCFFPSIWPETFSYVVAELMALDAPICCFDLGAPAERLRAYPRGRVIPDRTAESALKTLTELLNTLRLKG